MNDLPLIANQAKLEKIVGRSLPAEVFNFAPWGHRLVVVRAEPIKEIRGIHLPNEQVLAQGWVLSVGQDVGLPSPGAVGICPIPRERLLGCNVLFGAYAGLPLKTGDPLESEFESQFTVMCDLDVWGTIGDPPEEVPL